MCVCAITARSVTARRPRSMSDVAVHHHECDGRCLRAVAVRHLFEEDRDVAVPALRFADLRSPALRLHLRAHFHAELAYAVPFREHPERDLHDGVPAHQFADHGVCGALRLSWAIRRRSACGCSPPWPAALGFVILHGREWTQPDRGRLDACRSFPTPPGRSRQCRVRERHQDRAAVCRNILRPDRHAHAARHARRGLPGRRRSCARWFIPILLGLWLVAWLGTPAYSPFHYGAHVLLVAAIVSAIILWLKPKVYDASDVEVAGLYWHFVDLVWMFIFPLVYLMSTRII